jgi:hypothetical protein
MNIGDFHPSDKRTNLVADDPVRRLDHACWSDSYR